MGNWWIYPLNHSLLMLSHMIALMLCKGAEKTCKLLVRPPFMVPQVLDYFFHSTQKGAQDVPERKFHAEVIIRLTIDH